MKDVEILVKWNADVNYSRPGNGTTALIETFFSAYIDDKETPEIIDLLIKAKSNVNAVNHAQETALMYAVDNKSKELRATCVKSLLLAKADVNLKDCYDLGVYDDADRNNWRSELESLIRETN